jgi:hypothetical protein
MEYTYPMRILLVQPPFVQLNAPYPAVHYLEAFLRARGHEARVADHSIALYRRLFSREGLVPVFDAAREAIASVEVEGPEGDTIRSQLARYLSYEEAYLGWIDGLVGFLSGGDPAFAYRLSTASDLPRGERAEAFLEGRGGKATPDEASILATKVLEDLGDLVKQVFDPAFDTVRYGERLASSRASFDEIRSALALSRLISALYDPFLDEFWEAEGSGLDLLLVSVPFPGCLLGALALGRSARARFGPGLAIALGGGYVSTELRGLADPGVFDFCDYLSFDSGYGSLASILEVEEGSPRSRLYRTMFRDGEGRIVAAGFPDDDSARSGPPDGKARRPSRAAECSRPPRLVAECDAEARIASVERAAVSSTFPDYRGVDFSSYLRAADSRNPMHRLWSDSPWLKYHLARGCYWRRCAFCDTELEYVADFRPSSVDALCDAADAASARTGLFGLHFVDEAMPMAALLGFARANRARAAAGKRPFHYWGNVRFDSAWTPGRCEYLAASGLVAVSGGIEIATERGLEMTDKGFDLARLVRTLVALKRSGLLVHAYLIYGFPGQSALDIVESAEICRQLFSSGLVDSAFWHRFVLTRHSRMYHEWRMGRRPGLKPIDSAWGFANNDLGFEGEGAFDRFEEPLSASLAAWMSGDGLERPARAWFDEAGIVEVVPVALDLVEGLIDAAEGEFDSAHPEEGTRVEWVAGMPLLEEEGGGQARLLWAYRGGLEELRLSIEDAHRLERALSDLASAGESLAEFRLRAGIPPAGDPRGDETLAALAAGGLVAV